MLLGNTSNEVLQSLAAQTATNNSGSTQSGEYRSVTFFLNVTVATGTTPSMTVKVQDSPDNITWYDTGSAFAAVTVAGQSRLTVTTLGTYVRAVSTITGTTPSFTYSIQIVGGR